MRIHPLPLAVVVLGAAGALGLTLIEPAPVPRYTQVMPPADVRIACQPMADGTLIAHGDGELDVAARGEDPTAVTPPVAEAVTELTTVRGLAPSGGVLSDTTWSPCQSPATEGTVVFPSAGEAELRLTNADTSDASVDLTLYGPEGEIEALGSRGINLAPGESRPVAVSVLAEGVDGPVGVAWKTSRGRVVAAGVTTGDVRHVAPTVAADTTQVLPGVGEGGKPVVVLTNPGADRASASIEFHSPNSTYTPEGGQDVSVPAHATVVVDLSGGTAGEAGTFTVTSDEPLAAALFSGAGERRGVGAPAVPDVALAGAVPGGAILQFTNLGDAEAQVSVTVGERVEDLLIPAGATATVDAGEGEAVDVTATSSQPVVGVAVMDDGTAVIPLAAASETEVEPLDAELVRTLR